MKKEDIFICFIRKNVGIAKKEIGEIAIVILYKNEKKLNKSSEKN